LDFFSGREKLISITDVMKGKKIGRGVERYQVIFSGLRGLI